MQVALFRLRAECGAVLKLDSGDMLAVADLTPLLRMEPGRDVWVVQALGQPTGNLNGWAHARRPLAEPNRNPNPNPNPNPQSLTRWAHALWPLLAACGDGARPHGAC